MSERYDVQRAPYTDYQAPKGTVMSLPVTLKHIEQTRITIYRACPRVWSQFCIHIYVCVSITTISILYVYIYITEHLCYFTLFGLLKIQFSDEPCFLVFTSHFLLDAVNVPCTTVADPGGGVILGVGTPLKTERGASKLREMYYFQLQLSLSAYNVRL